MRQEKAELKREKDNTIQQMEDNMRDMRNERRRLIQELEGYDDKVAALKAEVTTFEFKITQPSKLPFER